MNIPLLRRLRDAERSFLPLVELGTDLDQLRGDLDELEAFGFALERHPYRGVAYRGPADRLCPDQIEDDLGTLRVGRRIAVWKRVSSTNDVAVRAAGSTANEGLVILAEEQTAGRGRRGRAWTAPPGSSILMSVLLFPPAALAETAWLTALGAVATAEVVAAWTGLDAGITIKWPNDVRVGGRKIAGVLVERGQGAVIGIGLNANVESGAFPPELRATATSLCIITGRRIDRSELRPPCSSASTRGTSSGVLVARSRSIFPGGTARNTLGRPSRWPLPTARYGVGSTTSTWNTACP